MEFFAGLHDCTLRRFHNHSDSFILCDEELIQKDRFPSQEILGLLAELMENEKVHTLPVHTQVLVANIIFASGSFQQVIGDASGMYLLLLTVTTMKNLITVRTLSCQMTRVLQWSHPLPFMPFSTFYKHQLFLI